MATRYATLVVEFSTQGELDSDDYQSWLNDVVNAVNREARVASLMWGERTIPR